MTTGISGFVFFWSKNGHFVTVNWFSEIGLLKHLFYSVLGCALKLFKKVCFGLEKKALKLFTANCKAPFWYFLVFLVFVFFFFCVFLFGGFKGQVRWERSVPRGVSRPLWAPGSGVSNKCRESPRSVQDTCLTPGDTLRTPFRHSGA